MKMLPIQTVVVVIAALACAGCADERRGIVAYLPSRTLQGAVSEDVALCSQTTPRFIMDLPEVGGDPTLDVKMEATDTPCIWTLPKGTELQRGVYTLLIRFDTVLTEATTCGDAGARVPIGAFAKKAISFPFPESFDGFTDDQFRSRPGDAVPNYPDLKFDTDSDGRDNLAEIANSDDPCAPAAPVNITVTPELGSADEGAGIPLVIEAVGGVDDAYDVVVTFTHANGAAAGTAAATFSVRSDSNTIGLVSETPASESWTLDPGPVDELAEDGSGRWRIVLHGDEPFVGPVAVRAQALLDAANVLATANTSVTVNNLEDPTLIVDEDGVLLDRLTFAELRGDPDPNPGEDQQEYEARVRLELLDAADVRSIRVSDQDLDDDVSTWQARLIAAECPAITSLEREQDTFALRWAPQNADAVAEARAAAATTCTIELVDPDGVVQSTSIASLSVSPLLNDIVAVTTPGAGSLGMPRVAFTEHIVPFEVIDPDEIADAPTCAMTLIPRAGTTCTAADAFPGADGATCVVNGTRADARWPFAIVLHPGVDYFTDCGAEPAFDVELSITDVSPDGSDAALTLSTCGGSEGCVAPFFLRTSNVVEATTLDLGAGVDRYEDVGPLIDGVRRVALIRAYEAAAGERTLAIADIGADPPVILARVPAGGLRGFEEEEGARRGAVDEVNGRFITLGRNEAGTLEVLLVNYGNTPASPTWTTFTVQSQCDEPFNDRLGGFVADTAGNLYITCIGASDNTPPPRVVKFDGTGARTSVSLAGVVHPNNDFGWEGEHIAVVTDPVTSKDWLLWPDEDGVVAVDLSTVGGTLSSVHVNVPLVQNADLDAHAVLPERGMYLFLHEVDTDGSGLVQDADNDDAILRAIVFNNGPTLHPSTLALPETSASNYNGFARVRLVPRAHDAGRPVAEPDLLIQPGFGDYPLVDLDSFSIVDTRLETEFPSSSSGLYESPDRRFVIAPAGCEEPEYGHVLVLYPWDGGPAQTLTFDSVCEGNDQPEAGTFSLSGDIGVWIDGAGVAWIFDFVEAAAGAD